jgi:hypothetical protein
MYITQFLNWFVDHGTSSKWNYVYCAITGPPLKGAIKVNVDDNYSFNNTRRLGFGGVLRDNNDNWLVGFSLLKSLLNSLCVKLNAILNGLKIVQVEGFKNCIIKSYSTLAGNFASHRTSQLHPYAPLIQQIRHLHRGNLNISFRHTLVNVPVGL